MPVRELIAPYFLDTPRPGLGGICRAGAEFIGAKPADGTVQTALGPIHRELAAFAADSARAGAVPVIWAGDCCASIPVLAGLQRAGLDPVLVWLDAHGDFNTWETSPSGFLGGMPLAMLAGRGEMTLMRAVGAAVQPETRIYLSDARDLDRLEADALQGSGVHVVADLDDLAAQIPDDEAVYVHFDSDVISSDEVPAQSYPVAGGPGAADVTRFFTALAEKSNVVAASISAWNPELDADGSSGRICQACFDSLLQRIG